MNSPHIVRKTTSPTSAPVEAGIHWINTSTNEEYFSVGTSSINDWIKRGLSTTADALITTVWNQSGSSIPAFSVVYINGSQGTLPTIALAQANTEATSTGTYGVTTAAIANNAQGTVVAFGLLTNVNTSAFVDGNPLWLSPSVAGGVTTTKPVAPNHIVFVGTVVRAHPSQGKVEIKIANGYELEELHNVLITTPSNNQVLSYDSATSLWKNTTPTTGTVTSVSVASANGLAGTVSNPTTTPSITLSTSVSGLLKGNGTAISAASAGTDYQTPITGGASTITTTDLTASKVLVSNASGKVAASSISDTTLGYLDATSSVQTQLNGKEPTITGGASSITSSNLTASKALVSDGSGKVSASAITSTELGYVSGVTSAIQTQLNAKEPTVTKGNLTESTSSVLTVTNGTNSVIGSGTSIQVKQSSASQDGYLSSTDWSSFNGKTSVGSVTPSSVGSTNTVGVSTDAARADHAHKGVSSVAKNGSSALYGDVTLSAGTGVTLTQVGNDISIASSAVGSGTVTNVSVVSANGLAGTVANPTTTPAITLSTSVTGLLKGNGTAISAATSGTDYQAPITGAASTITTSNLTVSKALVSDGSGKVATSTTSSTELGYVSGVTSAIQTQLNGKEPTLTKGNLTETGSAVLYITNGTGSVIGSGVTIQVQQADAWFPGYLTPGDWNTFASKQSAITGAATTITSSNLTASRALASDSSGKVAVSATTSTELGYVSGVTSSIQTQFTNLSRTKLGFNETEYSTLVKFGTTVASGINGQSSSVSGTQASLSRQFTTGIVGKIPQWSSQTISTAGANCGYRMGTTTSLPYIAGGFKFSHFFQIADDTALNQSRNFVGFNNINLALAINTSTNTDPFRTSFINFFGVGHDSFFGDTNLKLFYNGGTAGSTTVIDLGSGFSITSLADFYQVSFYNAPDSTDVYYEVKGWLSGNVASGVITTNLPYNLDLYAHSIRSNGGNAAVAKLRQGSMKLYITT